MRAALAHWCLLAGIGIIALLPRSVTSKSRNNKTYTYVQCNNRNDDKNKRLIIVVCLCPHYFDCSPFPKNGGTTTCKRKGL